MVLTLDGSSEHVAHIWTKSGISICWRHLVTSTESSNPIFFFLENTYFALYTRKTFWATIYYKYPDHSHWLGYTHWTQPKLCNYHSRQTKKRKRSCINATYIRRQLQQYNAHAWNEVSELISVRHLLDRQRISKRPVFLHTCATCSELLSIISTTLYRKE